MLFAKWTLVWDMAPVYISWSFALLFPYRVLFFFNLGLVKSQTVAKRYTNHTVIS